MDRIDTIIISNPFPGAGPGNTLGITAEADPGLTGPITVHLDEQLWEAFGKPERLNITIEKEG